MKISSFFHSDVIIFSFGIKADKCDPSSLSLIERYMYDVRT